MMKRVKIVHTLEATFKKGKKKKNNKRGIDLETSDSEPRVN